MRSATIVRVWTAEVALDLVRQIVEQRLPPSQQHDVHPALRQLAGEAGADSVRCPRHERPGAEARGVRLGGALVSLVDHVALPICLRR